MQMYRVKMPFMAIRPDAGGVFESVALKPGVVISVRGERTSLRSGLVDVLYDATSRTGPSASMFNRADASGGAPDLNRARSVTLRMDMDRERINLIEADIETGMTFVRIATTELSLGNLERTTALLAKAWQAYDAMSKL